MILPPVSTHPEGESENPEKCSDDSHIELETFDGKIFVEWDPEGAVTPLAQLPFFIEFLKIGCRFEPWVDDCPLRYVSNNAPEKVDVLGSIFLSVLSGHNRFAHLTTLMSDSVNSRLLGMNKIVSDDSARRGLKKIDERSGVLWLQEHLQKCYEPLLSTSWILDCDVTVKPLYGRQEGAVLGYNPHKKGRPCHTYHTYMIASLRLVLDVEVQPGNQGNASHSMPGLINLMERIDKSYWPRFVRGDCDWGSNNVMSKLESLGAHYLFKLKKHKSVNTQVYKVHCEGQWRSFKADWEVKADYLEYGKDLKKRRVVIVRRRIYKDSVLVLEDPTQPEQMSLALVEEPEDIRLFEYSVLITNLDDDLIAIAQHYRDRADSENLFDEMKNQWGWGGYTTKDLKTSRFMSRIIALIYNWWNLYVRLANPDGYQEAITSKPLLLAGIGRLTQSGRQKKITITSQHAWSNKARDMLTNVSQFFSSIRDAAPQLSSTERWAHIIAAICAKFANLKGVGPPGLTPV